MGTCMCCTQQLEVGEASIWCLDLSACVCAVCLQVRAVPLDRLLLESDSPNGVLDLSPVWLEALPALAHLPQQLREVGLHQLSRPCMLRWTLQLLAAALDRPEEEVAAATFANARRIFCSGSSGGGSGGSSSLGVAPQ